MRETVFILWALGLTQFLLTGTASGQVPFGGEVEIPDPISCPECRIELQLIAELVLPSEDSRHRRWRSGQILARKTADGGFVVANQTSESGKVFFLDSTGQVLHTVGSEPDAPLHGIHWMTRFPDGTLVLFDVWRNERTTISPDGNLSDTERMEVGFPLHGEWVDEDRMVISTPILTPERVGLPLHLVNLDGTYELSFGEDSTGIRMGNEADQFRVLGRAQAGGVWAAKINEFRIELWGSNGKLQRRIIRRADGFPPWEGGNRGTYPWLRDVREDTDGLLWVLLSIPDPSRPWGTHPTQSDPGDQIWDTIVEVIEPRWGLVLARIQTEEMFLAFDDDHLFNLKIDDNEVPVIQVWRLKLLKADRGDHTHF
jgi:hypothetical protein